MAMNGLLNVPYMLQLAHRWTAPAIAFNAVALVTFVPLMFVTASKIGPTATAAVFASMHGAFLAAGIAVTRRRLTAHSARWWFVRDVGPALVAATLIAAGGRLLLPAGIDRMQTGAMLLVIAACAFLAAVAATPAVREWLMHRLRELRIS
jgi:hypothetical protein